MEIDLGSYSSLLLPSGLYVKENVKQANEVFKRATLYTASKGHLEAKDKDKKTSGSPRSKQQGGGGQGGLPQQAHGELSRTP